MIKNHSLKWKGGLWGGLLGEDTYYQVWQSEGNTHGTHIGRKGVPHQNWLYTYMFVCVTLTYEHTHRCMHWHTHKDIHRKMSKMKI